MIAIIIKILRTLSALCLATLLIVVMLVIFNIGTWASEFSEFLLAWTVMFGGALAYAEKSHLGLDILVEKFDPITRLSAFRLSHILVLLFAATVMLYGGGKLTMERFDMGQVMPSLGISKGWLYLSVPLSGLFICLTAVSQLFSQLAEGETTDH
jgi:TRAP-type C4-dicarboxylate transport system permease small subunit